MIGGCISRRRYPRWHETTRGLAHVSKRCLHERQIDADVATVEDHAEIVAAIMRQQVRVPTGDGVGGIGKRISPIQLPRLLGILVVAFVPGESRPFFAAAKLFRGIAIQLAHRWVTGQVVADAAGRSVLLWSVSFRPEGRRPVVRELLGALVAALVGITLVIACSLILLVPCGLALVAVGLDDEVVTNVILVIVGLSVLITCWRAFRAHEQESVLMAQLPPPSALRWHIDSLAAIPARRGHGGRLLDRFLEEADQCDAEVVLHCSRPNVAFYRRHGFFVIAEERYGGQRLMLRKARSNRPRMGKGHQRKRRTTGGSSTGVMTALTKARRSSGKPPKAPAIDTET